MSEESPQPRAIEVRDFIDNRLQFEAVLEVHPKPQTHCKAQWTAQPLCQLNRMDWQGVRYAQVGLLCQSQMRPLRCQLLDHQ